jgi:multidrug efflux system membrane fusion protein
MQAPAVNRDPADQAPITPARQPATPKCQTGAVRTRLVVGLALLALGLAGGWWWQHRAEAAGAQAGSGAAASSAQGKEPGKGPGNGKGRGGMGDRPVPVRVATVQARDMDVIQDALGTVTPTGSATVRVRVDGLLQSVHFTEGQMVKAGQLLARIDPRPFEVALAQVQGQLQRDQALLANARLDLQRYADLVRQEAAPRQQLEAQQALVAQYEGTIRIDQAAVDNARLQLDYTRVTAPVSGRIGLRQVDAGNMVKSSDTTGLAVINQVQPVSVVFAVPQDQLPAVLAHQADGSLVVQALDRAGSQVLARGQLQAIDNQIDATTGTVKLKASFANADGALFPNQFVNTRLFLDRLKAVPTVPEAALLRGAPGNYVYVVADGKARIRVIKVGPRRAGVLAALEGLKPGEQVVTEGTDRLEDGSKVEVVQPEAAEATASGASSAQGARRHAH